MGNWTWLKILRDISALILEDSSVLADCQGISGKLFDLCGVVIKVMDAASLVLLAVVTAVLVVVGDTNREFL